MNSKYAPLWILGPLLVVLDQFTKWLVIQYIQLGEAIPIIPGFFDLVHVLNRGASFGMLNRGDISWQRWFFIGISLCAMGVIVFMTRMSRPDERMLRWALGFIFGGAAGNLVDRVRQGMVVDFLDFYIGPYHWPAFNVADMAISGGAILLILAFYLRSERTAKEKS